MEEKRRPRKIKALAYKPALESAIPSREVARAFKALYAGVANDRQQKIAMEFIVNEICRVDDIEFRPEAEGGYAATALASGKRFVGQQVRALLTASGQLIEALPE